MKQKHRSKYVGIRLNEIEDKYLAKRAKQYSVSKSEFIRRLLMMTQNTVTGTQDRRPN